MEKVENEIVQLSARIVGSKLPANNGYLIYSALKRSFPWIVEESSLQIAAVAGPPRGHGYINLKAGRSLFRLRGPKSRLIELYDLFGRAYDIHDETIYVADPVITRLRPAARLSSYLVTIRGGETEESFLHYLNKAMQRLDLNPEAKAALSTDGANSPRKIIEIRGTRVVGFSVNISALNEASSLKLQIHGLGGRRKMGAGIFFPREEP